jgi:beta-mannanase
MLRSSRPARHRALRLLALPLAGSLALVLPPAAPAAGQATSALSVRAADNAELPARSATPRRYDEDTTCLIGAKLVPTCGAYLGVAANPLGGETYEQAMLNWENRIGRTADIFHFYMRGQSTLFPTPSQIARAREPGSERLLLLNWRPTITWRSIADGAADDYLRRVAAHIVSDFNEPFMLTLHAEMEAEVNDTPGSGMTAVDFRDFFRHTVDVLRANGATNVVFVIDYIGAPNWGDKEWFEQLYPGDSYVDWIAEDPFAFGKPPIWLSDFGGMVDRVQNPPGSKWKGFYSWATRTHPGKPLMLAEWGVDEAEDYPGYKADFFKHTVQQMRRFPMIRALVYWDDPDAPTVGETRIDSSTSSLSAFRAMANQWQLTMPGQLLLHRLAVKQQRR